LSYIDFDLQAWPILADIKSTI